VAVGDFAAIDTGGTNAAFIARVAARTSTTITLDSVGAGTNPTNGTYTLRIGGAWAGPSGTNPFPFAFATISLRGSGDGPRVNFKNDQVYLISSAITHNQNGVRFEGYESSYGDESFAIFDSQTNNITILTASGSNNYFRYLAGLSSSSGGTLDRFLVATAPNGTTIDRCKAEGFRWEGFANTGPCMLIECEVFNCSLGAARGGYILSRDANTIRCLSYNNSGVGFWLAAGYHNLDSCIASSNNSHGILAAASDAFYVLKNCDVYGNGGDGLAISGGLSGVLVENLNFLENAGYGINVTGAGWRNGNIFNCGFGVGSKANGLGNISNPQGLLESGTVVYPSGATPWADPDNEDFSIVLKEAKGAGRGDFPGQTVGYPDIGAAQAQGGSGTAGLTGIRGIGGG